MTIPNVKRPAMQALNFKHDVHQFSRPFAVHSVAISTTIRPLDPWTVHRIPIKFQNAPGEVASAIGQLSRITWGDAESMDLESCRGMSSTFSLPPRPTSRPANCSNELYPPRRPGNTEHVYRNDGICSQMALEEGFNFYPFL